MEKNDGFFENYRAYDKAESFQICPLYECYILFPYPISMPSLFN